MRTLWHTFRHGVHPPDHKELTAGVPIRRLPFPDEIVLPLRQHAGAPARLVVREGDRVERGDTIAEADGHMSAPVHASAAGRVTAIGLWPHPDGTHATAVRIAVERYSPQALRPRIIPEWQGLSREELIAAVKAAGVVGLGGAAFPAHIKLAPPPEFPIDTLVVNGCECEPYLTCDHRLMLERTGELLAGTRLAMRAAGAARALIGVEDNKPDAIDAIRARLPEDGSIAVQPVRAKYPQGSEKTLIKALLGLEVPSGGLPSALGVVVNNVGTLAQIGRLVPAGEGLVERVVTVAGPGVGRPGDYLVPLGTPLRFVLEEAQADASAREVVLGGPMMGAAVASLDVPVAKGVSGILVFPEGMLTAGRTTACIKCGECVTACPMGLNPSHLGRLAAKRQYETMASRFHLNDCFECGSCSYVCPARIPLVQQFRVAKAVLRSRAA